MGEHALGVFDYPNGTVSRDLFHLWEAVEGKESVCDCTKLEGCRT